jgi:hypothetical protein
MAANPEALVIPLLAESEAVPLVIAKLTVTFAFGTPRLSASTVRVTASVAPCPTQRVGATATRSSAEEVPTTVACCVCGEYEAGARAIVIVLCPVAVGVAQLEDSPASSLSTEQEDAPLHAENCKPLVALQAIVALRAPE